MVFKLELDHVYQLEDDQVYLCKEAGKIRT